MDMRAGGAAQATTPDTPETKANQWSDHVRAELEEARRRSILTNARFALMLRDPAAEPCELAKAGEEAALAAGRVAGFARMLCRALPLLVLAAL